MKEHIRSFQRQGSNQKDRKAELFEWFHSTAAGMLLLFLYIHLLRLLKRIYNVMYHLFILFSKKSSSSRLHL